MIQPMFWRFSICWHGVKELRAVVAKRQLLVQDSAWFSAGGPVAAGIVLSIAPTFALALYAQRYLVEGLSLGAVKG